MSKIIEIKNPAKRWWPGDSRVEEFMKPVRESIEKYDLEENEKTDIYNRSYEAVYNAIKKYS